MEVSITVIKANVEIIAAASFVFGVKGLVDVADEMDEEFEGLVVCGGRQIGVEGTGGHICYCGYDAAF